MPLPAPLFVYGSLKRGFRHHRLLRRAVRLGPGQVLGCRLVLLDGYPALIGASRSHVVGELYRVDRPLLHALDAFEDCPVLYRRRLAMLAGGCWAFAYFASDGKAQACLPIPGSEWRE